MTPDGSLWLASPTSFSRINASGAIATFDATFPAFDNAEIASTPVVYRPQNGTLWFPVLVSGSPNPFVVVQTAYIEWAGTDGRQQGHAATTFAGRAGFSSPIALFKATLGSDGRVWFPFCQAPPLGICGLNGIDASGTIVEANDSDESNSVTSGPNGNLYSTGVNIVGDYESFNSVVTELTTSGSIVKRIALPPGSIPDFFSAGPEPSGLAFGADRNLWVVETGINKIARIKESGEITQFDIPTPNAHARNIVLGTDGNMWFTEFAANKIGRITTAGTITEYAIPTPHSGPDGIMGPDTTHCTFAPHGFLWFTESNANAVARLEF